MSTAQLVAIISVVLPALALVLWPLARGRQAASHLPAVAIGDNRLELLEEKASVYRALKEIAFDHEAGHLSDDDYRALQERYESRAGELLGALDALGPMPSEPVGTREPSSLEAVPARRSSARHPVTLVAGAVLLVIFGVVIGVNAGRFSQIEPVMSGPDTRLPVQGPESPGAVGPPRMALEPGKPVPPEILAGMLNAARQSLMEGRYSEAIAAYQAVLKRDPRNVDAMTHLGLIVAIGGHADAALETFDKAIQIDPAYAPIYLYRGQVLYEVKQDYPGAVQSWQRFLALVRSGEDHERVAALVKEAQDKQRAR
jgi:tetratricopeptide (TPR) repeat protein